MKPVAITYTTLRKIIQQSKLCPVETGGILVGTLDPMVVFAAGQPGGSSIQKPTQFTSDPQQDKLCLQQTKQIFGQQITTLGYWHKHPAGLLRPSRPDIRQAKELTTGYSDNIPLLVAIVNRQNQGLRCKTKLNLYSVDRLGKLSAVPWKSALTGGELAEKGLNQSPRYPQLNTKEYWTDEDFQFYKNPVGRKRIKTDIKQLKDSSWIITTARDPDTHNLIIFATKYYRKFKLILPPEYPLNPPLIYALTGKKYKFRNIGNWNSLFSLTRVLESLEPRLSKYCFNLRRLTCHPIQTTNA